MSADVDSLGFVGLGVMGGPQAENLARAGISPVVAYDPVPERLDAVVAAGAVAAADVADVARRADIVFLSLPGDPEVEAVLGQMLPELRAGHVVVSMGTASLALVQRMAALLAERDAVFVDAPVARGKDAAVAGTLSVMVGAEPDVLARIEAPLRAMATDISLCGPTGAGAVMKLANNVLVAQSVVAIAEVMAIVRRTGLVSAETVFDVLECGSAASFVLSNHGRKFMLPDAHGTQFPNRYMLKDVGYLLTLAASLGVDTPQARVAADTLRAACDAGLADQYFTSLMRVVDAGRGESAT